MAVSFNKEVISEAIQEVLAETIGKLKSITGPSGKTVAQIVTPEEEVDMKKKGAKIAPMEEETISVGHIDDEPGMLKQFAFDTAQYAAKLYKLLHHYEQMEDHVDFPNWWQHKVMMSREYMSKATHYLEFETMKPQIDAAVDGHSEEELDEARDYQALVGKTVQYGGRRATVEGEEGDYIRLKFEDGKENLVSKSDFENKEPYVNEDDDVEAPATGFEDDSAKAPKGDKKLNKAASKNDKIISTYKKIKPLFKKAAAGDKEALAIVKANQDVIKAYRKLTQTHLAENKATCCGKCGRTHVKGTECKKPFLTGQDHCRVR
jgi:hypothetical protein